MAPKKKPTKEEEVFEVEHILDKRIVDGTVEYKILWKGYPKEDSTWETEENVAGCKELIEMYEKNKDSGTTTAASSSSTIGVTSPSVNTRKRRSTATSTPAKTEPHESDENSDNDTAGVKKRATPSRGSSAASSSTPNGKKLVLLKEETTSTPSPKKRGGRKSKEIVDPGFPIVPLVGFEYNDVVEEIVGCKQFNKLAFYIKWVGRDELSWVESDVLRYKDPQKLIDFYEERIHFGEANLNA
eukprot:gene5262-6550_t